MQIRDIRSTDLFAGTERQPLQILQVTIAGPGQPGTIRADGTGISTPEPVPVPELAPDEERVIEVPVAHTLPEGTTHRITVRAGDVGAHGELTVEATGWTMFMVSHFHYDPVWWNTQAGYTSTWDSLPPTAQDRRMTGQETAFHLVRAHLETALKDADYKFVLAELDYLRPYWDACPQDRAALRQLIADGRVELVGGMYNEPNTNLTSLESTIRNVIYGVGYQRDVVGGDPRTGWMLDVFGHDPAYPGIMADAGLTSSSWARGPFHQWGPGDSRADMQFPNEFEWISPDGRGLLTSYMTSHYSAGWRFNELPTLAEAEAEAYVQFRLLKNTALTPNVVLPVGTDHVIPSRWATEIHRDWTRRYVWPKFVCAIPAEFFAAVRAEVSERGRRLSPQSRDMNPLYTGKDVSYIDTKQAQRAIEVALLDGEKLATLTSLIGAPFPAEAVDRAWRLLCYGAHHDAITGTESDQVYLDLLGGWREAWELADRVRGDAVSFLAGQVDTRGDADALIVLNPLSGPRTDVVSFPATDVEVRDDLGRVVPSVATDGSVSFVAADVPATGYRTYRTYRLVPGRSAGWRDGPGSRAENDAFLVEARGGVLTRIFDKRAGKELLRPGTVGNELVMHDEYPQHPEFGEGPWHLLPTGVRAGTASVAGSVRALGSPAGQRLITSCQLGDLAITSEMTLWDGIDRIEFRTRVDGSIGQDHLLRVRFPFDVAGARPVYETGHAVIGRTFGWPSADAALFPWTQDNPAYGWAGLSSAARVVVPGGAAHALGVAEVVASGDVRDLVAALAGQGVTATTSSPSGPRYGSLALDSNLPDVRISVGDNDFSAQVLAAAGLPAPSGLLWVPAAQSRAGTWVPGADVRGVLDLPVLVVPTALVPDLIADLADATISAGTGVVTEPLEDYSVALLNRGTPGTVIEPDGTLHLSLMRSCSGWPSGIWIDPPKRTAPDGSSFSWGHWSHTFEYALAAGRGDWRAAGLVRAALAYNHALLSATCGPHSGTLPGSASLLSVSPPSVVVTALKPAGNPLAAGRPARSGEAVTLRCYESAGRAVTARVRCFVPFQGGTVTNVLESPGAVSMPAPDGELSFDLGPAQTRTVTAVPSAPLAPATVRSARPAYARYWLHNAGPAPAGHQPVTVHVEPRSADLSGPVRLQVTVSTTHGASGSVELIAPPGVVVSSDDLQYELGPDGYQVFDVLVEPPGASGIYHVAARVDGVEDVVTLRAGASGPEWDVRLDTSSLSVPRGGVTEFRLRLTNRCQDEVRGTALLVSPFGNWELTAPWSREFALQPGADSLQTFQVRAGSEPMTTWLLAKVMAFGTVHYTPAVPLIIT